MLAPHVYIYVCIYIYIYAYVYMYFQKFCFLLLLLGYTCIYIYTHTTLLNCRWRELLASVGGSTHSFQWACVEDRVGFVGTHGCLELAVSPKIARSWEGNSQPHTLRASPYLESQVVKNKRPLHYTFIESSPKLQATGFPANGPCWS